MGKTSTKHAGTLISSVGPSTAPKEFIIVETDAGARGETTSVIQDNATTADKCIIGTTIKFLNIHIQSSSRGNDADNIGWMEYVVIYKKETDAAISITQTGTKTLGEIATNLYRNNCWWSGFISINKDAANGAELSIKVPQDHINIKMGDQFILYTMFRSQNLAATGTDSNRLITSFNYKAYN